MSHQKLIRIVIATVLLVAVGLAARMLYLLWSGSDLYLTFVIDDFYYYLLTAKHIVQDGISSFDGFTPTNGYHPLWMAVLCMLVFITGGIGKSFFVALVILFLFLSWWTITLYRQITLRFFESKLAWAFFLLAGITSVQHISRGMEEAIALPLYALLVLNLSKLSTTERNEDRHFVWLGFLSSLLVLARLDSGLFVLIALIVWLIAARTISIRNLAAFALGGVLVPIYFGYNYFSTEHLMTVSAQAKQLRGDHSFNWELIATLWARWEGKVAFSLIALCALCWRRNISHSQTHRIAIKSVVIFTTLYFVSCALLTDWSIFEWYLYALPMLFLLVGGVVADFIESRMPPIRKWSPALVLIIAVGTALGSGYKLVKSVSAGSVPNRAVLPHARELARFTASHPGHYAMGDRGGLTSYLLGQPMLQLEGLIADQGIVDHIRNRDSLLPVLHQYGINYMIETTTSIDSIKKDGCYTIMTPHPPKWNSPHMTAVICDPPLIDIAPDSGEHTLVFGVDGRRLDTRKY